MSSLQIQDAIDDRRREGARLCFEAMKLLSDATLEDMADKYSDYLAKRYRDAERLLRSLPPMPPEAEGAILALAEYVHDAITNGDPNMDPGQWVPFATMTQEQVQSEIDRLIAIEDDSDTPRRNVIAFPERAARRATA